MTGEHETPRCIPELALFDVDGPTFNLFTRASDDLPGLVVGEPITYTVTLVLDEPEEQQRRLFWGVRMDHHLAELYWRCLGIALLLMNCASALGNMVMFFASGAPGSLAVVVGNIIAALAVCWTLRHDER